MLHNSNWNVHEQLAIIKVRLNVHTALKELAHNSFLLSIENMSQNIIDLLENGESASQ